MIEIVLAHSDLARVRFAHSPVEELVASLRVLQDPGRQPMYGRWLSAVRPRLGGLPATALTGDQLAPAGQIVRDAVGMSGLVALGAATLGASRAWVVPLTCTLLVLLWVPAAGATYQQVLTWMLQPAASAPAAITASVLGVTGVLAYAILGPRP